MFRFVVQFIVGLFLAFVIILSIIAMLGWSGAYV